MTLNFDTEDQAWDAVQEEHQNDPYADNHRLAYIDDQEQVDKFEEAERKGCCGSVRLEVTIGGRAALIGCNFGH